MSTPPPQASPDQRYPGPGSPAQGWPQQGYPTQSYPQPDYQPQGYQPPQQGYPQLHGYPRGPGSAGDSQSRGPAVDDPTSVVGSRVGQYILDSLIVGVPYLVLYFSSIALTIMVYSSSTDLGLLGTVGSLIGALAWLLVPAGSWFVFAWWPHKHGGQTLAMKWLKLKIIDEQGAVPTLGALSLRWVLLIADGFFFGMVGLIVMSTNPRHQRLGDQVAKTLVIRAS